PTAADPAAARPVDPALYGSILEEMRTARWDGLGIDPDRYVRDRLSYDELIRPLLENPDARIVLHRQSRRIGEVRSVDGSHSRLVSPRRPKDYPGRAYYNHDDGRFHLVGIVGEDWFRQTLYMLAHAGVRPEQILVEETFEPERIVANALDATLAEHTFDSVTIGTMGELTRAVERVLRARVQPEHIRATIGRMETFLAERARSARSDRRPRWQARLDWLRTLLAETGPDPAARLRAIENDPMLAGPLAEWIRVAERGAPVRELPMRVETVRDRSLPHRILEVDGKKHLLIHIGGAHGDMAYHVVRHLLEKQPGLRNVNVYGSAGSLTDTIPPDTLVLPSVAIGSIEPGRAPVALDNAAQLEGAVTTRHANVSTLLREHKGGLEELIGLPAGTVDIESYHVARAVAQSPHPVAFRAILRVSDVATSAQLGAHREDREATSDYDARRRGEERVVVALGLVDPPAPSPEDR
ncbi:MAG: hypothetical protein D6776_08735, partial [Planctomycetota bacterium]